VQIVRFATQEVWEGQINGRALELSFSFSQEGQGDIEEGESYTEYVSVDDDLGAITMDVPAAWDDVDGSPWTNDTGQATAAMLQASPDLDNFLDTAPGVLFIAVPLEEVFDPDDMLDSFDFSDDCSSYEGRAPYQDSLYGGKYDYYTGCQRESVIFVVVAAPEDESFLTIVVVQAVTAADLEAADRVFDTFSVVGELPGASAGAGGASLEVNNQSDEIIAEVNISTTDSDTWGENWLGNVIIRPGESYRVTGISPDIYDIRPLNTDGEGMGILYSVPLDEDHTLTVYGIATLPANAELRFQDDFTDNRHNWGREGEGPLVTYYPPTNGEFCILIKDSYRIAWEWYEPFRPAEFFAEVKCSLDDADAECGLGFGPDGDNLFWFQVHPSEQEFGLDLLQNDAWQDPLIEWTTSYYIDPTGSNYLALGRVGNEISVYVNGILIGRVTRDIFPTGRIGIGGGTYDTGNVTACLDNLKVWQLN
jgi:hypothetical protein